MQYQRFISYLYQYKNGEKVQNTGYVKVEQKGNRIRISLKSKVMEYNEPVYYAYLISQQTENGSYGYLLDKLQPVQGMLTYQYVTECLAISDFAGVLVRGEQAMYMTLWQDVELLPEYIMCMKESSAEQFHFSYAVNGMPLQSDAQAFGTNTLDRDVQASGQEGGQAQIDFHKAGNVNINEGQVITGNNIADDGRMIAASVMEEGQVSEAGAVMGEGQVMEGSSAMEEGQMPEAGAVMDEGQVMEANSTMDGGQVSEAGAVMDEGQVMEANSTMDGRQMSEASAAVEEREVINAASGIGRIVATGVAAEEQMTEKNTTVQAEQKQSMSENSGKYRSGADYLFKNRDSLPAVEGSQLLDCIRIVPQDLGLLHMQNWRYGNNSFLSHGYYRYRYLLLGKLKFQDNSVKIILGVPSIYTNKEKYLANMFGFEQFVTARRTDRKLGQFGYWIVELTS